MTTIVCDSSSLISMGMNCFLPLLEELSSKVSFVVSEGVIDEIIHRPAETKRFKLSSIRFENLLEEGIIEAVTGDPQTISEIVDLANNIFYAKHKPMTVVHKGEAEALAIALDTKGVLLIDERTLKMLLEDPLSLKNLLQKRVHRNVREEHHNMDAWRKRIKNPPLLRSSDLIAYAYSTGLLGKYFGRDSPGILEASLWSLKFSGCSITPGEIQEYLRVLG